MPYRKGDQPSTWNLAGVEIPYQEGDITEEEFRSWREANSCDHIRAGTACDGTCVN